MVTYYLKVYTTVWIGAVVHKHVSIKSIIEPKKSLTQMHRLDVPDPNMHMLLKEVLDYFSNIIKLQRICRKGVNAYYNSLHECMAEDASLPGPLQLCFAPHDGGNPAVQMALDQLSGTPSKKVARSFAKIAAEEGEATISLRDTMGFAGPTIA
jgi:hypothetical protein